MNKEQSLAGICLALQGMRRILSSDCFKADKEAVLKSLIESLSESQLQSKTHLAEILQAEGIRSLGTVFLCAGWNGLLAFFLLTDKRFSIDQIFLFETDPLSVKISEDLNRRFVMDGWRFKSVLKNILDVNYSTETFTTLRADGEPREITASPDTIINTSCEHIQDFDKWRAKIPAGKLLILQSNDSPEFEGHVNPAPSLEAFKKQARLSQILCEGSLDLKLSKRWTIAGRA